MKQKRTFVTLLLVIALLCLGIAYAAVTQQTLTISGSAGVTSDEEKVNVVFTKAEVTGKPEGLTETDVTATVSSTATTATINVSNFKSKDDTATFEYTITNKQTDIAATLDTPTVTLTGEGKEAGTASGWFEVTTELSGTSLTANNEDGTLETASQILTVTVKLKETPVTSDQVTAAKDTITITINANPVATTVAAN